MKQELRNQANERLIGTKEFGASHRRKGGGTTTTKRRTLLSLAYFDLSVGVPSDLPSFALVVRRSIYRQLGSLK